MEQRDDELEIHLTLDASVGGARLREVAARHGLKTTHVLLACGAHPSQPLVTARHRCPGLPAALERANALRSALAAEGVMTVRVKIERDLQRLAEAARGDEGGYLEHHVKVSVGCDALPQLAAFAREHGAHLSRNAASIAIDGREHRFLTQRFATDRRARADEQLEILCAGLRAHVGLEITGVEREHVVHDSNVDLDTGWGDLDAAHGDTRP